jgi:YedE family putative selenium metabolism protein
MSKKRDFFALRIGIITAGLIIGILAATLQKLGNPANMGLCMACFERDIVGALGLHRAAIVQYLRPEIFGILLGATIAALIFREFKARTGSSPIVRFLLGMFAMIGALIFLGCPWRALLRLAGGDWNAIIGLIGLFIGITFGVMFLKNGYSLGRSYPSRSLAGWIMPAIMVALLILAIFYPQFGRDADGTPGPPLFLSEKGPGSQHAALIISLTVGLIIGFLAQRTRFCTMGSLRDVILMGDSHLLSGVIAFIVAAFVMNVVYGQFHPGFTLGMDETGKGIMQPAAHTVQYLNFLGMMLAGMAFALAGGCPGRQLILSGEGNGDAGVFVMGMFVGAGIAHNFNAVGKGPYALYAVVIGLIVVGLIGFLGREK